MASMDPTQQYFYLLGQFIPNSWEPWDPRLSSYAPGQPYNTDAWLQSVIAMHQKVSSLYTSPLNHVSTVLKAAFVAPNGGVHPQDAIRIINTIWPNSFDEIEMEPIDEGYELHHDAIGEIRFIIETGHRYEHMCIPYLRRHFNNEWL
jgi:hypothetical protein